MQHEQRSIIVIRSDPGNRDSRLQKELRLFVEEGYDVHFLGWDRERACPAREERNGVVMHRCRIPAPYASKWLFACTPLWWAYIFAFLTTRRWDAVHACDFDTIVPALASRALKGGKVVYDIYDFYSVKSTTIPAFLRRLFGKAERWAARRADAVVTVDAARHYLLGEPLPERLAVAMNCPFDAVQESWTKNESPELRIFYGGLIGNHRGIDKLVETTRGLDNVRIVMAGWITQERYRELLESAPHVEYIGGVDYEEALRLTYEADAVYSYYDPSLEINRTANSSKMYDAFMCATPVLANCEPPAAHVVAEGECGYCLPFDDDEGLRRAIVELRDNREKGRDMGRNGRRMFESELNARTQMDRILALYRELGVEPQPATGRELSQE